MKLFIAIALFAVHGFCQTDNKVKRILVKHPDHCQMLIDSVKAKECLSMVADSGSVEYPYSDFNYSKQAVEVDPMPTQEESASSASESALRLEMIAQSKIMNAELKGIKSALWSQVGITIAAIVFTIIFSNSN